MTNEVRIHLQLMRVSAFLPFHVSRFEMGLHLWDGYYFITIACKMANYAHISQSVVVVFSVRLIYPSESSFDLRGACERFATAAYIFLHTIIIVVCIIWPYIFLFVLKISLRLTSQYSFLFSSSFFLPGYTHMFVSFANLLSFSFDNQTRWQVIPLTKKNLRALQLFFNVFEVTGKKFYHDMWKDISDLIKQNYYWLRQQTK